MGGADGGAMGGASPMGGTSPWAGPPPLPRRGRAACSDLITGCAARLQALGVVPATVYLPILVKVDQIHQQLVADGADEARRVPANAVAGTGRKHGDVPAVNLASALRGKQTRQYKHQPVCLSGARRALDRIKAHHSHQGRVAVNLFSS